MSEVQEALDRLSANEYAPTTIGEAQAETDAATVREAFATLAAERDGLREKLAQVTGVAITQLFDTHRADVIAEFSADELRRVSELTAPLMQLGAQVEKVYRIGFDAIAKEAS